MPCRDYEPTGQEYAELHKRLDDVTAHLCYVLTEFESNPAPKVKDVLEFRPTLDLWWKTHKKQDAKRKAAEAAAQKLKEERQAALDKLSAKEKKLLGIKE